MNTLSKEAIEKYNQDPNHCPYCGNCEITADPFDTDATAQIIRCYDCGKKWYDTYSFIGIEEIKS
jgi:hypothetical protein